MAQVFNKDIEISTRVNSSGQTVNSILGYTTSDRQNFNFLYDFVTKDGIIKKVANAEKNLNITNISNSNPWYFNRWNASGRSNACVIDNEELAGGWFNYQNAVYRMARLLGYNPTLANCVGYAHGRVREIWDLAQKSGYIKKVNGVWFIPSMNKTIDGDIGTWDIPACNAYSFYDYWPNKTGFTKSTKFTDDMRPVPGAIMCWRNNWDSRGLPGHVAVVEAVYNYGKDDEYVIYSESAYTNGGAQWLVTTGKCYRNSHATSGTPQQRSAPYAYNSGYPLAGFLFSPVCQLSNPGGVLNKIITDSWTDEAVAEYQESLESFGKQAVPELKLNDKVVIEWFGNEDAKGKGKRVNYLNVECKIVKIDQTKEYPYGVAVKGKQILAYYQRDALRLIGE